MADAANEKTQTAATPAATAAPATAAADADADLADYDETAADDAADQKDAKANTDKKAEVKKGSYAGIHSSGFRDFLLKSELLRAITDCGFEHPSEGPYS